MAPEFQSNLDQILAHWALFMVEDDQVIVLQIRCFRVRSNPANSLLLPASVDLQSQSAGDCLFEPFTR